MELKFDEKGLIPAIVQDHYTKEVLTLAYLSREAPCRRPTERRRNYTTRNSVRPSCAEHGAHKTGWKIPPSHRQRS